MKNTWKYKLKECSQLTVKEEIDKHIDKIPDSPNIYEIK